MQEGFPLSGKFASGVKHSFLVPGKAVAGVQEAFSKVGLPIYCPYVYFNKQYVSED
ncbi:MULTISPECIES: hypothetical protein [unclassified Chryseobacterium]|uniref:hypothetical protein n=1 Tax=unclassified Chryseobacterium TaxID=2593645 RepID=UPI003017D006